MQAEPKLRQDSLFNGDIVCFQKEDGYRFSIDAVLLAGFAEIRTRSTILDLGCGSAVLGMILLYRHPGRIEKIIGLEYQNGLVDIARRNVAANVMGERLLIKAGDVREIDRHLEPESVHHVICNPPFYTVGSGRPGCREEARLARHQFAGGLEDFLRGAAFALKNRSVCSMIYPAEQSAELFRSMLEQRLQPKRARFVYGYPEAERAELILVEAVKNGGTGMEIMAPLFVYSQKNGDYSAEVARLYKPRSGRQNAIC